MSSSFFRKIQKRDIKRLKGDLMEMQKKGNLKAELALCQNLALQHQEINHLEDAFKFHLSVYQIAKTLKHECELFDARSMLVRFLVEVDFSPDPFWNRFGAARNHLNEMALIANRKKGYQCVYQHDCGLYYEMLARNSRENIFDTYKAGFVVMDENRAVWPRDVLYRMAIDVFDRCVSLGESGDKQDLVISAVLKIGNIELELGNYSKAFSMFTKIVDSHDLEPIETFTDAADVEDQARALLGLAQYYRVFARDLEKAWQCIEKAISVAKSDQTEPLAVLEKCYKSLATLNLIKYDFQAAEKAYLTLAGIASELYTTQSIFYKRVIEQKSSLASLASLDACKEAWEKIMSTAASAVESFQRKELTDELVQQSDRLLGLLEVACQSDAQIQVIDRIISLDLENDNRIGDYVLRKGHLLFQICEYTESIKTFRHFINDYCNLKGSQMRKAKALVYMSKSLKYARIMYSDMKETLMEADKILKTLLATIPDMECVNLRIQTLQQLAWYYYEIEINHEKFGDYVQECLDLFQAYNQNNMEEIEGGSILDTIMEDFDYFHGRKASVGLSSIVAPGMSMVPRKKKRGKVIGLDLSEPKERKKRLSPSNSISPRDRHVGIEKERAPILKPEDFESLQRHDSDDKENLDQERRLLAPGMKAKNRFESNYHDVDDGDDSCSLNNLHSGLEASVTYKVSDPMLAKNNNPRKSRLNVIESSPEHPDSSIAKARKLNNYQKMQHPLRKQKEFLRAPAPFTNDSYDDNESNCETYNFAYDDDYDDYDVAVEKRKDPMSMKKIESEDDFEDPFKHDQPVVDVKAKKVVISSSPSLHFLDQNNDNRAISIIIDDDDDDKVKRDNVSVTGSIVRKEMQGNFVQVRIEDSESPVDATITLKPKGNAKPLSLYSSDIHDCIRYLIRRLENGLVSFRSINGFTVSATSQDELFCDVDGNSYISAYIDRPDSVAEVYKNWCRTVGTRMDRRFASVLSLMKQKASGKDDVDEGSFVAVDAICLDAKSITCPIWHITSMLARLEPKFLSLSNNKICDYWDDEGMLVFPDGIMSKAMKDSFPTAPPPLSNINRFECLKTLNLSGNKLTSSSILQLLARISTSVLESLSLADNLLDDSVLPGLSPFLTGNLKELNLSGNHGIKFCGGFVGTDLLESFGKCKLVELRLARLSFIGIHGIRMLDRILNEKDDTNHLLFHSLEVLDLSESLVEPSFTDLQGWFISRLLQGRQRENLRELDIHGNPTIQTFDGFFQYQNVKDFGDDDDDADDGKALYRKLTLVVDVSGTRIDRDSTLDKVKSLRQKYNILVVNKNSHF